MKQEKLPGQIHTDGGPIYFETDFARSIVEPWNATTASLFIFIALYWFQKLRKKYSTFIVLTFCTFLLLIGGIGGTLYHAFRNSFFLYMLDVVPIILITVLISLFLWEKLGHSRKAVICLTLPFLALDRIIHHYLPRTLSANSFYLILALIVFFPMIGFLRKTHYIHKKYILESVLFFIMGIYFRASDFSLSTFFPMGTHWLWHLFSAISCLFLSLYLYKIYHFKLLQENNLG